MYLSKELIKWYNLYHRELPWRQTSDPYIIWLSEIILQQTRVEQGLPYFNKFLDNYPTISHLAVAPQEEVMKLWQGLGYYSRARNLHETARTVHNKYDGNFPSDYLQIRQLKGIGDYTAAAVASFAFNAPYAVVDGNVYRVLSRFFGDKTPIDSTSGKKIFASLAQEILDKKSPALHNQAIMEFGAMLCRPALPDCKNCPVRTGCFAFNNNQVTSLPVKGNKTRVTNRYFNYLLVRYNKTIYLNKRKAGDIWEALYELPLIETLSAADASELMRTERWNSLFSEKQFFLKSVKKYPVHKLSHQHIYARLIELELTGNPDELFVNSFIKISEADAGNYPVPRLIEKIFADHLL